VADRGTTDVGEALRAGAVAAGAETVLAVMEPRAVDGEEPPAAVAAALLESQVFIVPTSKSLSHTRARKAASDRGARGATLPGAGELGTNLAELGIGTNEAATMTGNVLEDEKILGSVHVAFGASAGIGGTVSVPVHLDFVVLEPTLDIGGTRVIDAGRFVL